MEEFRNCLKSEFNIDARVTNKTISYKHPERSQSIRGGKLGTDYDKEELLNEFIRKEKTVDRGERNRDTTERAENINVPNVDWGAIERATGSKEDRLSKQSSDGIIGEIQRKVRAVEERTNRATGEYKESIAEPKEEQRPIKSEHERNINRVHRPTKSRDFGLDR